MRLAPVSLAATLAVGCSLAAAGAAEGRAIGVHVDPWHVDEWAGATGVRPDFVGRFEAFAREGSIEGFLRESERRGLRRVLITWEPWKPTPPELGGAHRPQPGYRNSDIAAGAQDAYVSSFARSLAGFRGRVLLRYAHEMNGTWYPWSTDPIAYRRAWRRMVRLVRGAGATNVRFMWSVNPSLYVPFRAWRRSVRVYWPGRRWVDVVGATMLNFGGVKRYAVRRFLPRLRELRRLYHKPVSLPETNTAFHGRVRWLRALRRALRRLPWVRSVALSQLSSRGQARIDGVGRLDWDVSDDPRAARVLRGIARDGS